MNGIITDTYTFDAFGNILEQTGDTYNPYLYNQEQYDANTGLYYLRNRYMDPSTGRFVSMDSYAGSIYDPVSLHKYLYANGNSVMYIDPTGYYSLADALASTGVIGILARSVSWGIIRGAWETAKVLPEAMKEGNDKKVREALYKGFSEGYIEGLLCEVIVAPVTEKVGQIVKLYLKKIANKISLKLYPCYDNFLRKINHYDSLSNYMSIDEAKNYRLYWNKIAGNMGEKALKAEYGGELQKVFFTQDGDKRIVDLFVDGIAYEAKVGYTTASKRVKEEIAKDVQLLSEGIFESVEWHFFTSPTTGKNGLSKPLRKLLEEYGIEIVEHF